MSAFGCVVCGEPVQGLKDTCSEECELVQDAAVCPECHEHTEPFAWDTGRPLHHDAHLTGCSRGEPALRSTG